VDGWTLRSRRRKAGLTAAQVARVTGTSESNIAAYERGAMAPGVGGRVGAATVDEAYEVVER
jgi:transcriptional regulator with XRE-family HTH domain